MDSKTSIVLASLVILGWYYYHVAPDILWNDTCKLATQAYTGDFGFGPGGHALRNFIGHYWGKLPFQNYVYGQNLLSVTTAWLTSLTLGLTLHRVKLPLLVIVPAMLIMSTAHTIWFVSEITESYSLLLFLFSVLNFLYFHIDTTHHKRMTILALIVVYIVSILNHQLATLFFVLVVGAVLKNRAAMPYTKNPIAIVVLLIGIGAVGLAFADFWRLQWTAILDSIKRFIYPQIFFRECAMVPMYLAVNFPWLTFFTAPMGLPLLYRQRQFDCGVLIVQFLTLAIFASSYGMGRKFFLLTPCYYLFAIFVAFGFSWLSGKMRLHWYLLITGVAVVLQPVTYYCGYRVLNTYGLHPITKRDLPYRDTNRFYLWPGKRNAFEARNYVEYILATLPMNSVMIMDWQIYTLFRYVKIVESQGTDRDILLTDGLIDGEGGMGYASAETIKSRLTSQLDAALDAGKSVYLLDDDSVVFITDKKVLVNYFPLIQERYKVTKHEFYWEISRRDTIPTQPVPVND